MVQLTAGRLCFFSYFLCCNRRRFILFSLRSRPNSPSWSSDRPSFPRIDSVPSRDSCRRCRVLARRALASSPSFFFRTLVQFRQVCLPVLDATSGIDRFSFLVDTISAPLALLRFRPPPLPPYGGGPPLVAGFRFCFHFDYRRSSAYFPILLFSYLYDRNPSSPDLFSGYVPVSPP